MHSEEGGFLVRNTGLSRDGRINQDCRYRSIDGRCNWLKKDESYLGSTGQPRSHNWGQTNYADGISKPHEGSCGQLSQGLQQDLLVVRVLEVDL